MLNSREVLPFIPLFLRYIRRIAAFQSLPLNDIAHHPLTWPLHHRRSQLEDGSVIIGENIMQSCYQIGRICQTFRCAMAVLNPEGNAWEKSDTALLPRLFAVASGNRVGNMATQTEPAEPRLTKSMSEGSGSQHSVERRSATDSPTPLVRVTVSATSAAGGGVVCSARPSASMPIIAPAAVVAGPAAAAAAVAAAVAAGTHDAAATDDAATDTCYAPTPAPAPLAALAQTPVAAVIPSVLYNSWADAVALPAAEGTDIRPLPTNLALGRLTSPNPPPGDAASLAGDDGHRGAERTCAER